MSGSKETREQLKGLIVSSVPSFKVQENMYEEVAQLRAEVVSSVPSSENQENIYNDVAPLKAEFGSKVPSLQEQEEIYQKLTQLKAEIDRLCNPCPLEWTFFQGNCYFFSKSQRNWNDSLTACQEVEAQLVIIESAEEQSFLQVTSKNKGFTWIGLSDLNHEGTWQWVDGSPLSLSFMKYWSPGRPNNAKDEDCVEFRGDGWSDSKCDINNFWICKKICTYLLQ